MISPVSGTTRAAMRGSGKIRVDNGDVFAIPVFGPLSRLISAIIPGSGYSVAHNAAATFSVKDGVAHTDDFKVNGKLFGMLGHGDIHFLDDKLDFDVRINAESSRRHGADAGLQTFRIQRRRQPLQTELASEAILKNCVHVERLRISRYIERDEARENLLNVRDFSHSAITSQIAKFSSARTCRSVAAFTWRSSAHARSSARPCRFS